MYKSKFEFSTFLTNICIYVNKNSSSNNNNTKNGQNFRLNQK